MKRNVASILFALSIFAFSVVETQAEEHNFQAWQVMNFSRSFHGGLSANMELQTRFSDDASNFGQLLVRPSIGYGILGPAVLSVGYAYVRTSPEGQLVTHEHRPWQQLAFPILQNGFGSGVTIANRTRIEQRFRQDGDDMSWRLREQLRVAAPLPREGWQAIAWSEVFLNLDDTDWGQRKGLDRWRNFVGLGIPLSQELVLETGYLNQYVNGLSSDAVDHVFGVTLNIRH